VWVSPGGMVPSAGVKVVKPSLHPTTARSTMCEQTQPRRAFRAWIVGILLHWYVVRNAYSYNLPDARGAQMQELL
jgi:hypothetical protein